MRQLAVVSWAIPQIVEMVVDVLVGIVECHIMITGPNKRIHGSHATAKLFVGCLAHGLQHSHLLIFDPTINLKVIEIYCGHGYACDIWMSCTSTKQADSYNAHATNGGESASVFVHSASHFQMLDEELGLVFLTN
jgi:hypothetical protein